MNALLSQALTLILGASSIYFFYQFNFTLGVILLIWTISRLFGFRLQQLGKGIGEIFQQSESEKQCNCQLTIMFFVDEVFKSPQMKQLFEKLKQKKRFDDKLGNYEEWKDNLLHNYLKKYKPTEEKEIWSKYKKKDYKIVEKVVFNIKGNTVWKNEKIEFSDNIHYEIKIPHEFKNKADDEFSFGGIPAHFTIRIVIANGILKLQIGDYDKDLSPQVISEKFPATYKTQECITAFPLLYAPYEHYIPLTLLNPSMHATESYNLLRRGENKGDWTKDWKELQQDFADYSFLCRTANESIYDNKKILAVAKRFGEKRNQSLLEHNMKDPDEGRDKDYFESRMSAGQKEYRNDYWRIYLMNIQEWRENYVQHGLSDFYEEMP